MSKKSAHKEKEISLTKKIKRKLFFLARLNHHLVIKVYNGYGNDIRIIVLGQFLKLSPILEKPFAAIWLSIYFLPTACSLVITFSNAKIPIEWQGNVYLSKILEGVFSCSNFLLL